MYLNPHFEYCDRKYLQRYQMMQQVAASPVLKQISSIRSSLKSMVLLKFTVVTIHTTTLWYSLTDVVSENKIWIPLWFIIFQSKKHFPSLQIHVHLFVMGLFTFFWDVQTCYPWHILVSSYPPKRLDSTGLMSCTVVVLGSSSPADLTVEIRKSWQSFHLTAEYTPPLYRLCTWSNQLTCWETLPALFSQRGIKCLNTLICSSSRSENLLYCIWKNAFDYFTAFDQGTNSTKSFVYQLNK